MSAEAANKSKEIVKQLFEASQNKMSFTDNTYLQGRIQNFQNFIKKTKNLFSFANILLVSFEIVPFTLNTTICTIKNIIEWLF